MNLINTTIKVGYFKKGIIESLMPENLSINDLAKTEIIQVQAIQIPWVINTMWYLA